jgi:hypothetical protein
MINLLSCPFCGEAPASFPSGDGTGVMIECVSGACVNPHVSYYGRGVAASAWNHRAATASPEGGPSLALEDQKDLLLKLKETEAKLAEVEREMDYWKAFAKCETDAVDGYREVVKNYSAEFLASHARVKAMEEAVNSLEGAYATLLEAAGWAEHGFAYMLSLTVPGVPTGDASRARCERYLADLRSVLSVPLVEGGEGGSSGAESALTVHAASTEALPVGRGET